jgi:long-chain fatty acid transport protein
MRPNVLGARAIGMGGGFSAIADDPTAVWTNPAGPAFFAENVVYLGGTLVVTQRSFEPSASSPLGIAGRAGQRISESGGPTFIPAIGFSTRFGFGKTRPTRFALSLLAYDAFGGSIRYSPDDVNGKGILYSQILSFEIAPALSYQVTDVLAVGAALRIGVNAFNVENVENAFSAQLSMRGVGIGATLGLLARPHPMVSLGAVYRTPLSARMSGGGPVSIGGAAPENRDGSLSITWPQSFGLALAVKPHWRVLAHLQGDWYGWSSVQKLTIELPGLATQVRAMRFQDSWQVHAGLQVVLTANVLVRAGYALDTNAATPATIRRENIDGVKHTLAGGLGVRFWKIYLDAAFEALLPTSPGIEVANHPDTEGGTYHSRVYVVELAAQVRF